MRINVHVMNSYNYYTGGGGAEYELYVLICMHSALATACCASLPNIVTSCAVYCN